MIKNVFWMTQNSQYNTHDAYPKKNPFEEKRNSRLLAVEPWRSWKAENDIISFEAKTGFCFFHSSEFAPPPPPASFHVIYTMDT